MLKKASDEKKQDSTGKETQKDSKYTYDEAYVDQLRKDKPWTKDVKHFNKCNISALAAMKMLKHSLAGVKKGREGEGGVAVEVMGLLVGKPQGDTIIIMDAYPLPVEGIEYKVEAADEAQNYMIELTESLELRRKDRCIGWYHSHPFEVSTRPQYFMSSMDVSTQTLWQNSIPQWTAIVVDPLRSIAKQEPQLGCFRVYPPTHNPPESEGPDGLTYDKENMQQRWGASPGRYYQLQHTYFMSSLGNKLLGTMSNNNLWIRVLSSTGFMEQENRDGFSERVKNASHRLDKTSTASLGGGGYGYATRRGGDKRGGGGGASGSGSGVNDSLAEGSQACAELAIEQCAGHCSQVCKALLFNQFMMDKMKAHCENVEL